MLLLLSATTEKSRNRMKICNRRNICRLRFTFPICSENSISVLAGFGGRKEKSCSLTVNPRRSIRLMSFDELVRQRDENKWIQKIKPTQKMLRSNYVCSVRYTGSSSQKPKQFSLHFGVGRRFHAACIYLISIPKLRFGLHNSFVRYADTIHTGSSLVSTIQ